MPASKGIRTNDNKIKVAHHAMHDTAIIMLECIQNSLSQPLLVEVNIPYIELPRGVARLSLKKRKIDFTFKKDKA